MSSDTQSEPDPRVPVDPNFEQYGWALPKRKSLDGDEDLDGYLAIAPVLGSMGLFLKIESLSWMAVALALLSLGSRKVESYKWSSFMMSLTLGIAGVFTIVISEMRPQLAETAAAAARGVNPLQQVLKTLQLDKVLKSFGVQL